MLHLSLQLAYMILQLPARPLEGIVDGESQIGMPLVGLRGAVDIDFPAVRKRQADIDLIKSACPVMTAGCFQHHPASRHATKTLFEVGHMLGNGSLDFRTGGHALKFDFSRRLHGLTPIMCTGNARSALHRHFRFGVTLFGVLGDFRHRGFRQQEDAGH